MKIVLAIFAICIVVSAHAADKYSSRFDEIDVDAVLSNERLIKQHHECLMDRGTCTKDLAELKKIIIDALDSGCGKCTEKQLASVRKVIRVIHDKYPSNFSELKAKYDPEGKYMEKYREDFKKEGIAI